MQLCYCDNNKCVINANSDNILSHTKFILAEIRHLPGMSDTSMHTRHASTHFQTGTYRNLPVLSARK